MNRALRSFSKLRMSHPIIAGDRVEVALASSHELGEGALWSQRHQAFLHVDIYGPSSHGPEPAVYVHDPYNGKPLKRYPMPSFTGTVVPRAGGGLVVALADGIAAIDEDTGAVTHLCNPDGNAENRFNDGKCAPDGRFWVGTMGRPGKVNKGQGGLYVLHASGAAERALSGITISNGLAWSGDGKTMYYIDTPTDCVYAFDYDAGAGAITNQRVAFAIPEPEVNGHPDGMTIDSAGNLWVAQWGGGKVVAYEPATGRVVAEVRVPAAHTSSCAFGGQGLTDLYITTAKEHLTPAQREAQPGAGHCFLVRNVGWTGVPAPEYRG